MSAEIYGRVYAAVYASARAQHSSDSFARQEAHRAAEDACRDFQALDRSAL